MAHNYSPILWGHHVGGCHLTTLPIPLETCRPPKDFLRGLPQLYLTSYIFLASPLCQGGQQRVVERLEDAGGSGTQAMGPPISWHTLRSQHSTSTTAWWHFAPRRAERRMFPVCADLCSDGEGWQGGKTHKLENPKVLKHRQRGFGGPWDAFRVQPSPQPPLKGSISASVGLFGQTTIIQMTSLSLPLTLVAFRWTTHRSKSLYPITSLLSHACPLASYII